MSERPIAEIIKSCDAYIEFAEARRVFSDVGFYKELKDTIQSLKADNEKLREDRDSWRRVAEKLEREKQALAGEQED